MKFGMRWLLRPPRSASSAAPVAAGSDPPLAAHSRAARVPGVSPSRRERLIVAGLAVLSAGLLSLIYYRFWVMPYLLLAILVTSLWRIRSGAVCLLLSQGILLLAILSEAPPPWFDGFEDSMRLTLLGLLGMGARAVLDGLERQRRTEQRLIGELSTAVEQLRESERRQTEAAHALTARHHLLHAILESVDNGIFLVDAEGRISFANERLKELLELNSGEMVGRDAVAVVLAPLAERCRGFASPRPDPSGEEAPEAVSRIIELVRPTRRLLCQYVAPVRDDAGGLLGRLHVYSDLPDRERLQELLEARVEERTRELQSAQDQLVRSERLAALGQFSATMAHELRNPLNVVKLSVHYVTNHLPRPDEKLERNLSHMNQSVDRACAIINDLLAFSRLPPPQLRPVAVNELVRETILALPIPADVAVEWLLAPGLPPVPADARQIEQAVGNLGMNALQAMPEGGRLTVRTHQDGGRVQISIQDTGSGVPLELQDRVFEPFFSTKVTGTGLGLPLVHEIATAHGGHSSLQSSPGEGACFTLSLPVGPAVSGAAPASPAPSVRPGPQLENAGGPPAS